MAAVLSPARYLAAEPVVVERREDGIEHALLSGRRLALRGPEIVEVGPAEPEVDGGGRAPPWSTGAAGSAAPARYVFWKGRRLWGAETFLGPLHALGTLPQDPLRSFDWLGGTGVATTGGAVAVPPAGGPPGRLGVAAVEQAVAADARRGLLVTALGHAWLTVDGGASYRDVSAELGSVTGLEAREGVIVATTPGGRERVVTEAGAIVDREASAGGGARRPVPDPDPFADASHRRPLEVAVARGLPLREGGVVVAERGLVGRFDLATLRTTSVAPLDAGLQDAECTPLRANGGVLLACVGPERAAVVDLEGAPRTELSFDLAGASDLTRFVIGDDALGFLGPCDGTAPRAPEHDRDRGGDPTNASRQQVPVFCVRAGKDDWVEHRLAPAEVEDVIAWIPRASGGAMAVLARTAPFLDDRERVQVRGPLRVVRLARSEPPLGLGAYSYQRDGNVDDSLMAHADDTVTGWLSGNGGALGDLSVTIDPAGHVRVHGAPPYVSQIVRSGPLALAGGEDGRLWETVDAGQRWAEVAPPPAALRVGAARPSACSLAGCQIGGFFRLGWTGHDGARFAAHAPVDLPPGERRPRERYRRPVPPPPVVRLVCAPAAPAEGRRIADSMGFGYTAEPRPRTGVARIGALGTALVPWSSGPQMPSTGDVEVGWTAPLDVTGAIRRLTLPIARLGLGPNTNRIYDLRTGYLLTPEGGLSTFAVGSHPGAECFARLLELAGIARPLGACATDRSVGVDLGGHVMVLSVAWNTLQVSAAEVPPLSRGGARSTRPGAAVPVALHELHVTSPGGPVRGFAYGIGARAGAPVIVVVDAAGQAALAPVDATRGTLGAEEPLRPLSEAALGSSPACAPRPGEARVVLPFEGLVALDRAAIRGLAPASTGGVAVLRWSRDRACLDAIELPVHDDRFDESPGPYEPQGTVRKVVARFDGKAQATLLLVGPGTETRQRLSCSALLPGGGEGP